MVMKLNSSSNHLSAHQAQQVNHTSSHPPVPSSPSYLNSRYRKPNGEGEMKGMFDHEDKYHKHKMGATAMNLMRQGKQHRLPIGPIVIRLLPALILIYGGLLYGLVFAGVLVFPAAGDMGRFLTHSSCDTVPSAAAVAAATPSLRALEKVTQVDPIRPLESVAQVDPTADMVSVASLQRDTPISGNVLPNILLIGAPKAGSHSVGSWLFENGVCPPEVFDGEPDYYDHEVQFFDQQSRYEQGLDFYAKRFQHCSTSSFAMDATPNTISFPGHVENIYKQAGGDHLKKLKVIVLLREPVSRELSFYNHKAAEYLQTKDRNQWYSDVSQEDGSLLPFQQHVDNVLRDIKDPGDWGLEWGLAEVGNYARHLSAWLKFVDRKNLLAISYDEFKADNKAVEDRVRNFLGFNFQGSVPVTSAHDGKAEEKPTCVAQAKLNVLFEPLNQDLYKILNENPGHSAEQRPFPSFPQLECTGTIPSDGFVSNHDSTNDAPLLNTDAVEPGSVVLPNILLIGAQQAGNNAMAVWLFENGACRPEVVDDESDMYTQQVQFFDQQSRYEQGLGSYAKRFEHCRNNNFRMDATPNYLAFPENVEKLYKKAGGAHLKNLKVIVVLREPVSRELSLYNNKVYEYLKTKDRNQWYSDISKEDGTYINFDEHLENVMRDFENTGEWGTSDTSDYASHLRKWLNFVDRKNLLAVSYGEYKDYPRTMEGRVRDFLGYDFPENTLVTNVHRNKEKVLKPSCVGQSMLNNLFEPRNQELYKLLNDNPGHPAEQSPFPTFEQLECEGEIVSSQASEQVVLPNILMVGAQKAGTTALGVWLFENGVCRPEVFDGEPYYYDKEVQFFDNSERYPQGMEFYSKRFEHCRDKVFAMDATPNTLRFPEHVEETYKKAGGDHLKNLKVITVFREPVARELSLYNHRVFEYMQSKDRTQWYSDVSKEDGSLMSFHEYTDILINDLENPKAYGQEWGLANEGQYSLHLKKWMKFIDRKNLLVIAYDELKHTPRQVEQRVRDFLGFDFPGTTTVENSSSSAHKVKVPECATLPKLDPYFSPMNNELYKILEEHPGPDSEQRPFPRFEKSKCSDDKNKATATK